MSSNSSQPDGKSWSDRASDLEDQSAVEHRSAPQPGTRYYLCLSDLGLWLKQELEKSSGVLLDYGCGGSPYRSLARHTEYKRAELEGYTDLDYIITPGQPISAPDASFDTILSTQVLEHVAEYKAYLRECFRLLKPGGRLLLTTHGMFEDHGMPYDYFRWTCFGLSKELKEAGLEPVRLNKLTVGPRALIHVVEALIGTTATAPAGFTALVARALRFLFQKGSFVRHLHRWADQAFGNYRIAENEESRPYRMYVGIATVAIRPPQGSDTRRLS